MRPAEVATLRIIHYEPSESNSSEWYKPGYSWYCIGYIKNKGEAKNNPKSQQFLFMKKNPEVQKNCLPEFKIITAKKLRKIRDKYASRIYSNQNPTLQYLEFLSRLTMRYKIDHYNSGMYYAEGDTFDSDLDADPEPEPEALASTSKAINENTSEIEDIYDLYRSI
ncbi:23469_t:CDS:2 [Cetraspora pellucida]|uniref:23469_t:CDS:1 n=1 Tax=Cetraspora pellucida TaxID=1433469 RepID=A0A9N9GG32_9GLOM|nr:23469_t:CDS:2 [Cetraspora pellucida]